jgi:hypothetical protein
VFRGLTFGGLPFMLIPEIRVSVNLSRFSRGSRFLRPGDQVTNPVDLYRVKHKNKNSKNKKQNIMKKSLFCLSRISRPQIAKRSSLLGHHLRGGLGEAISRLKIQTPFRVIREGMSFVSGAS